MKFGKYLAVFLILCMTMFLAAGCTVVERGATLPQMRAVCENPSSKR